MCSRYFLDADGNVIAYTFRVPVNDQVRSRFNIAPTQDAAVVRTGAGGARELAMLRWGLVPFWAKDLKVGTKMINARSEEAAGKPAFREALKARRCVIPASGFYEWRGEPGRKQPFAITLPGTRLFAFAGLWERWRPRDGARAGEARGADGSIDTFAIMTTDANEQVAKIHDRMPVLLEPGEVERWLEGPVEDAMKLLKPYAGPLALRAVSRVVSNVNNDVPECLDDAEASWDDAAADAQGKLF